MFLSPQTVAQLKVELKEIYAQLVHQEEALVEASGAGDNSQNGDIFAVFEEQSKLNTRLTTIEKALREHDAAPTPDGEKVQPGTLVEVIFGEGDSEMMIFGSVEESKSHTEDVVTPQSPIGTAIAGHRTGDVVTVSAGATFDVTIGKVELL